MKLKNKTAVVTGGSSGIGRAMAERFADDGADVIIVGRRQAALEKITETNERISFVAADVTSSSDIGSIVDAVKERFDGRLDILVNNAGWCPVQPLKEITMADFDRAFSLDVRAVVDMTIQMLPYVLAAKGSILNLSTIGTTHRDRNLSMYIGAKAAVENFTRVWALELAENDVRVNAIAPGAIDTNIWNVTDLSAADAAAHKKGLTENIPMKRMGQPEEVASVAAFLVSDEASYVTGAVYAVDGGAGAF